MLEANAVGKMSAEADRAYLAGLIDGDGCIMACLERHGEKKFGFRVRVSLKITQKESLLLLFLARKYGVGKVRVNNRGTIHSTYDWLVRKSEDVEQILDLIRPYTKTKHKQIVLAKRILHISDATKQGLMRKARLADSLAKFNVRSKNRRRNFASMIKARISSND